MEQGLLYRTLFLIDDTRKYTNDFYIWEFIKIVLYNEGCFSLSLSDIHRNIEELTSLEYTEEDISYALSIWNNGEVENNEGLYALSSLGMESFSNRRKTNDIKLYIDKFLSEYSDKYTITKVELENLIENFIYQRFNENLKEISDILNHRLEIDEFDKKYDEYEREIINDFLIWDNDDKNQCVFKLIAMAYDYCMINSKCQAQEIVFSKIHFYLDSNIIFRLMGINGLERESPVKSLIDRCRFAGIKILVSNFVIEECESTINSQLQVLVDTTRTMTKLIPPATMSFAEEKSIKLDFYRRYYEWVRAGNKHRNYDGFKKCIINQFNELLNLFDKDDKNPSYKVVNPSDFNGYYGSLYGSKMDKYITETDVNSFMHILHKRENGVDGNEYFLISADQRLITWSKDIFPGQKSYVDFPSVWLSIILKYNGREKETDYKAFCQFIHLSIEPQVDDLENKIAIKAAIMSTDIEDDIKTRMINEVRDNYNNYKDFDEERIVHVAYAKTTCDIEAEVERRKDIEYGEKLVEAQKEHEANYMRQKKLHEEFVVESENNTIDAYARGRQDMKKEIEEDKIKCKIRKTLKINTWITNTIVVVALISTIVALLTFVILFLFGSLESKSKFIKFFENYGNIFSIVELLISVLTWTIKIIFAKKNIFSTDPEVVSKKIHEKFYSQS